MSTRCCVEFCEEGRARAVIYKHHDGYPDGEHGMLAGFRAFFNAVEQDTEDTRFTCAEYLAAKYVVWLARKYAASQAHPLAFLSVGITRDANCHGDLDYIWRVDCSKLTPQRRPTVTFSEAR